MFGIFQRAWTWYKKLPWYWKMVAWVIFVLLIAIIAVAILSPSLDKQMLNWFKEADKLHNDQVDENLEVLTEEEATSLIIRGFVKLKVPGLPNALQSSIDAAIKMSLEGGM